MADTQEIDNLQSLRMALVIKRRSIALRASEEGKQYHDRNASAGASHGAELKRIQEEIDAVDRALADEEKLRGSVSDV